MPLSAAIGAGIGAIGSIGSAAIQGGAAQQASQQQAQGAQNALNLQQAMFGQAQGALSPYIKAGQGALPTLSKLLTPGPSQTATLSQLPGFQFQSQWGDLAATNQLAAMGLGGSAGPVGTALSQYNQGLAGSSFTNLAGLLQNFANMGAGSASSLGNLAVASGQGQASSAQAQGNALASGTLGQANATASGLTGAAGGVTNALLLSSILGKSGTSGLYSGGGIGG